MEKIIIISGGSRGIGKATSIELAKQGYLVCINYRANSEAARSLEEQIKKDGGKAISIRADISVEQDVLNLFEQIDKLEATLFGLVNNAGVLADPSSLMNMTAERIRNTFETNVFGTFLCCREAIKRMKNGRSIVNISSAASKTGGPNEYLDYASTKGAIDTFTIGLAKELAEQNIRVNAVRPGFIETDIHKIPDKLEIVKSMIPMKRVGQPIEVAKAVAWLMTDDSNYTTGAIIDIAGAK